MKHLEGIALSLVLLAATVGVGVSEARGQADSPQQQPDKKASLDTGKASKTAKAGSDDRGQLVFKQNCARCHNAPQGFSSNISGTVAMHMRVRAGLSDADYKALRRFLNP